MPAVGIDVADLVKRLIKYALEGLAVAVACYLLPGKKLRVEEIGTIALTALAVFAILDIYARKVANLAEALNTEDTKAEATDICKRPA